MIGLGSGFGTDVTRPLGAAGGGGGGVYVGTIMADNPLLYYKLNESTGATKMINSGSSGATFDSNLLTAGITFEQVGPTTNTTPNRAILNNSVGFGSASGAVAHGVNFSV